MTLIKHAATILLLILSIIFWVIRLPIVYIPTKSINLGKIRKYYNLYYINWIANIIFGLFNNSSKEFKTLSRIINNWLYDIIKGVLNLELSIKKNH